MTVGWVAASTRGRALTRRTVGPAGAQSLATADSWTDARARLATTSYGSELSPNADRTTARRVAAAATVWQLRVLAGWLPPTSRSLARTFAAPMEIANIDAHLARLGGAEPAEPIPLGSLGVAWPRTATTSSIEQARNVLARSPWGDPGGINRAEIVLGLRVAWARRLVRQAPIATEWALGAAALLIARERFAFDREFPETTSRELDRLLGARWRTASNPSELAGRIPKSAAWALEDLSDPADLWLSELAIARRVDYDARRVAGSARFGRNMVAAVMALLLVDLWRITAAIEVAGRTPIPTEVFDDMA